MNSSISESFQYLKSLKNKKCFNFSSITCISFYNTNIINIHYLTSGKVNFKMYGFIDVFLSQDGSVHSRCWDITTEGGCQCSYLSKLLLISRLYKNYEKVLSITHHWGNAIFHSIVECLIKIGYYIPELLKDSSIKIHTYRSANVNYLLFLGFNYSRIVYGDIFAKRLLILEKGRCGSIPPIIHLYSIRNILRSRIISKPKYDVIIIKRYGVRDVANFYEVRNLLYEYYGINKTIIFYPNTSFSYTLNYFKYAKLIVAPHGAGLSHMIVSYNATIIEFLIKNLCYLGLAKKLNLKYFGLYETYINRLFYVNISRLRLILKSIKF